MSPELRRRARFLSITNLEILSRDPDCCTLAEFSAANNLSRSAGWVALRRLIRHGFAKKAGRGVYRLHPPPSPDLQRTISDCRKAISQALHQATSKDTPCDR